MKLWQQPKETRVKIKGKIKELEREISHLCELIEWHQRLMSKAQKNLLLATSKVERIKREYEII